MANQTLDGWGTSLCWFAEGVGGWSNAANRDALMTALFDPGSGLGLNYLRYNIGGGNDPLCGQPGHYACIAPWYHNIPGYEPSPGAYDWTQDPNQRWVLADAMSLGADLAEAFSNSPPYWMTNSGTSEGGVNGAPNLASGYYGTGADSFANYLATVAQHFSQDWGIRFHSLEPMNEPGKSWWTAGDTKQEGCAFDAAEQAGTIQDLTGALGPLGLATQVSAMDEYQEGTLNSSANTAAGDFYGYDGTARGDIASLNTHAYQSTIGSVALYTSALRYGKRLGVSEWGSGDDTGQDLSEQILADMYLTRPSAWTIWQPDWPGLVHIDYSNQSFTYNEAYYVFEQFTKFIRPGFQFLAISDPQSLAAYNARTQTLVIVSANWSGSDRSLNFQLDNFNSLGAQAQVYQTSASENFASLGSVSIANGGFSYSAGPDSVTTFVLSGTVYAPAAGTVNDNAIGSGLDQFNYSGNWSYNNQQPGAYDNDDHVSSTTNDSLTFQFQGQQARYYASLAPDGGILAFSVDGGPETYVDTYAPAPSNNVFLFATQTLPQGTHTLTVRVTGLKNPASSGYNVPADRIDVVGSVGEVGQGIYKLVN